MDIFAQMVERIIKEQEAIIGPLALEQAKKVPGLSIDFHKGSIVLAENKKEVLEKLVEQYKRFFGQASVEVCKDAVRGMLTKIPENQRPALLM